MRSIWIGGGNRYLVWLFRRWLPYRRGRRNDWDVAVFRGRHVRPTDVARLMPVIRGTVVGKEAAMLRGREVLDDLASGKVQPTR